MFRIKSNSKKSIVVVILVVLTLAAFSTLLAPRVRADLSEAKVLSYSWYVAPASSSEATYTGDLITVGEVQNVGPNIIESVAVRGEAYNATGDLVAWSLASFQVSGLLPEQKAPFYLDFTPESSVTGDQSWVPSVTNVSISINTVRDTNSTPYSGLTTAASSYYVDSSGTFTVVGIIQNNGSETTGSIAVVTTFYDASGTVVALNFTNYLTGSLAPGATVSFMATPTDNTVALSSKITSYTSLVQSVPLNASPSPSPSASSSPSASASPTSSPTATPSVQPSESSEPQPTDSSWLIYAAVGAVAIVVVAVAVLVVLRKRRK